MAQLDRHPKTVQGIASTVLAFIVDKSITIFFNGANLQYQWRQPSACVGVTWRRMLQIGKPHQGLEGAQLMAKVTIRQG